MMLLLLTILPDFTGDVVLTDAAVGTLALSDAAIGGAEASDA